MGREGRRAPALRGLCRQVEAEPLHFPDFLSGSTRLYPVQTVFSFSFLFDLLLLAGPGASFGFALDFIRQGAGSFFEERGRSIFLLLMCITHWAFKRGKCAFLLLGHGCLRWGCLVRTGCGRHVHHVFDDGTPFGTLSRRRRAIPPFSFSFVCHIICYSVGVGTGIGNGLGTGHRQGRSIVFLSSRGEKGKKTDGRVSSRDGENEPFPEDVVSCIGPVGGGVYVVASRNSTPISRGSSCLRLVFYVL